MRAVTESHKRASKGMAIDFALHLNQAAGFKKFNGVGPDDVYPATFFGLFCSLAVNAFGNIFGFPICLIKRVDRWLSRSISLDVFEVAFLPVISVMASTLSN